MQGMLDAKSAGGHVSSKGCKLPQSVIDERAISKNKGISKAEKLMDFCVADHVTKRLGKCSHENSEDSERGTSPAMVLASAMKVGESPGQGDMSPAPVSGSG